MFGLFCCLDFLVKGRHKDGEKSYYKSNDYAKDPGSKTGYLQRDQYAAELVTSEYENAITQHLYRLETYLMQHANMERDQYRSQKIALVSHISDKLNLRPETFYLSMSIIDRFSSSEYSKIYHQRDYRIIAIAAVNIAVKVEEVTLPKLSTLVDLCAQYSTEVLSITSADILNAEQIILKELDYRVTFPTAYTFLGVYSQKIGINVKSNLYNMATTYLTQVMQMEDIFKSQLPSRVAISVLIYASITLRESIACSRLLKLARYQVDLTIMTRLQSALISSQQAKDVNQARSKSRKQGPQQNSGCTNSFCASNPSTEFKSMPDEEILEIAQELAEQGPQFICLSSSGSIAQAVQQEVAAQASSLVEIPPQIPDNVYGIEALCHCLQLAQNNQKESIINRMFKDIKSVSDGFIRDSIVHKIDVEVQQLQHLLRQADNSSIIIKVLTILLDKVMLYSNVENTEMSIRADNINSLMIILFMICQLNADSMSGQSYDLTIHVLQVLARIVVKSHDLSLAFINIIQNQVSSEKLQSHLHQHNYISRSNQEILDEVKLTGRCFMRFITPLQRFISQRVKEIIDLKVVLSADSSSGAVVINKDEALRNAVMVLGLFHQCWSDKFSELVPFNTENLNQDSMSSNSSGDSRLQIWYNKIVNEYLEIKEDFPHYKAKEGFSFCNHPWILNVSTKSDILKVESMVQMRHELQDSFFRAMFAGVNSPYLIIEVRRDSIVRDAMFQLEPRRKQDLKKQLKVQFIGEEGVDERGVQKEFFQLIFRELMDPMYGIFERQEDSGLYWFTKSTLLQSHVDKVLLEEVCLIGRLIGLAIYNSVILDVQFPVALYKKLSGLKPSLDDLLQYDPILGKSMEDLLDFKDGDVKDVYDRSFAVDFSVFDQTHQNELLPNGQSIDLMNDNREQFVQLYVDFIFNKSCDMLFQSFADGFWSVCQGSAISLFHPLEMELLICGTLDLDFNELRKHTQYDGGYAADSPVVSLFWDVAVNLDTEQKKRLLFFTTGTDRVPVHGFSKLGFTITKSGPDSERLPSSHTCFNVLLLPEYSSSDKLKDKLLTALQNAEGFGMI
ncbi:hypothetical protein MIR68_005224 [Amoeboaphelidium protococcarum]|nr:hypothetical protein MIR68_005224 [Amoeboaphelidium protococcarum]